MNLLRYTGLGNEVDHQYAFKLGLVKNDVVYLQHKILICGSTFYNISFLDREDFDYKVSKPMYFTSKAFEHIEVTPT